MIKAARRSLNPMGDILAAIAAVLGLIFDADGDYRVRAIHGSVTRRIFLRNHSDTVVGFWMGFDVKLDQFLEPLC